MSRTRAKAMFFVNGIKVSVGIFVGEKSTENALVFEPASESN